MQNFIQFHAKIMDFFLLHLISSHQVRSQRPSLRVTVLKFSRRAAQDHLVTAIRVIGALQVRESLELLQCPIYL